MANITCARCGFKRTPRKCDECARRRARAWYAGNKKRAKATRKAYYVTHRAAAVARAVKYNKENRELVLLRQQLYRNGDPDRYREYVRKHYRENPGLQATNSANRRARVKNAFVEVVDRELIWQREGMRCHLCKERVGFYEMHVDHVVPLAKGGEHSNANCKPACPDCNLRKGVK